MTITESVSRTFRGLGGAGAPRLAGLPGVARDDVAPAEVLETERYDTDDRRLAAAGITLSRRRDGETDQWQLDLPDGDTAERLRVPAGPDAAVPENLDELVRGAARDRMVRPVGRIRVVRTGTRLFDDGDRLVATLVHDEITLATLGRSTEVRAWTEVELQATGPVDAIEARLADAGLRPGPRTGEAELDHLLRPDTSFRPAGRKGSAGRVLHERIAAQVARLAAADLGVRRGEPDAVHQIRVTARRLRSILRSFRPLLDQDRTEPVVEGLRLLGRRLAPARDVEVLAERIGSGLATLDPELLLGPVQAQVTRHFARAEAEAHAAVLETLDGDDYVELRRALDELVAQPPLTARASKKARTVLPPLVARRARKLDRALSAVQDVADRDGAIHTARKAAEQLRYAAEVTRPAVGKSAERFVSTVKGVQRVLGEHQDTVVARTALRELGAAADNGFSFGVLHARDATRAAAIEAVLPVLRAEIRSKKQRRWLTPAS
jgi:CHAD domain-containing protein